jgi:GH24 family phage-related lysozyme (muramidase)
MTRIESSPGPVVTTGVTSDPQSGETTGPAAATAPVTVGPTARSNGQAATTPDLPSPNRQGSASTVDIAALRRDLLRWEGETRHMYRDSNGFVTTGIGHLLKTAEAAVKLPWVHASTGHPASSSEVRTAFSSIAGMTANHKAPYYENGSDLRLPTNVVRDLAEQRLEREFLPGVRRLCPHFDNYPAPAQSALVDMAYNLGVGGLGKFKKLIAACERGDFATAAVESHRKSRHEHRNDATRALFLEAANLTSGLRTRMTELHP